MQFTHREWELISHRLRSPESIANALINGRGSKLGNVSTDSIIDICGNLISYGKLKDFRNMSDLEKLVIIESCEGSTFMAIMNSNPTAHPRQLRMWRSVAEILGNMLKIKVPGGAIPGR